MAPRVVTTLAPQSAGPTGVQELKYRLPYHWFPAKRLLRFEREEKERIILDLMGRHLPAKSARYLDVGCGDGRWTYELSRKCKAITEPHGLDFSEQAIAFARLINPDIGFSVQRAQEIDFSSGTFDVITAIEVIEHVEDGQEEFFLAEIRRVLKQDGLLILTTPSTLLPLPDHHFRHYTAERLQELLIEAGFNILVVRGHSRPCSRRMKLLRGELRDTPLVWKLFRRGFREAPVDGALDLIVSAEHG